MESGAKKRGPYMKWKDNAKVPRQTLWSRLGRANSKTSNEGDNVQEDASEVIITPDETESPTSVTYSSPGPSGEPEGCNLPISLDMDDFIDENGTENTEYPAPDEETRYADYNTYSSDEDSEDEVENDETSDDIPLYNGSRLTIAASMLLILTFALRHGLTGSAIHDLLSLIELHCLSENFCRSTVKLFHNFFNRVKKPLECHYFCGNCGNYIGKAKTDACSLCLSKEIKYFITVPLVSQLQSILSRPNISSMLKQRKRQQKSTPDEINDVYDGNLYRARFDQDGYFYGTTSSEKASQIHLSIQVNTDGVSLFRTSRFGIWPLYGIINELPPSVRFNKENRLFMGLWFGENKPLMNIFLTPMVKEVQHLYHTGILLNDKTCRVMIISSVADAPARCLMMNCMQYNGQFGCCNCYAPGERLNVGKSGGFSRIYPYDLSNESGHAQNRTHEESVQYGENVDKESESSKKKTTTPKFGIKGSTVLSFLPSYDIIRGTTIDYMHCVFLGVTKMFLFAWFDSKNREERWSLRKRMKLLTHRLISIQPPNFIKRMPRPFEDLIHWKASEFRSFLLFFSLPVLTGILEDEYLQHWMLLSQAIYIMSCDRITDAGMKVARTSLKLFCVKVRDLYGPRFETFNVHCLLHLCDKVLDLGPLWAHSCFYFEGFNGELRLLFHGTQNVQSQIMEAICIQQAIPDMVRSLVDFSPAKMLYEKMTSRRKITATWTQIETDIFSVGHFKEITLPQAIQRKLCGVTGKIYLCLKFLRIYFHGQIIQSMDYTRAKRRQSYTVCVNEDRFAFVKFYIKITTDTSVDKYFAVTKPLETMPVPTNDVYKHIKHYIVQVSDEIEVTPVESITGACICMTTSSDGPKYVVKCPNSIEID